MSTQHVLELTGTPQPPRVGRHWLGAPLREFQGPLAEVARHIPEFGRRPFVSSGDGPEASGVNPYYDVIVRLPTALEPFEIPVGIVSKSYRLVQHREVLTTAIEALAEVGINASQGATGLEITEHGERMALSLDLSGKDGRYQFQVAADDFMGLRLRCFNSVDGTTRFTALVEWLRLVCSNGLTVGSTLTHFRRVHRGALSVNEIGETLWTGIEAATDERARLGEWLRTPVHAKQLADWVDGPLKERWGVKAATRAYHIAKTGRDASLKDPFENELPSRRQTTPGSPVPGALVPAGNAFAVSQVLSWLAGQRGDVQDKFDRQSEIAELIRKLVNPN
jgi:hypothetical protein